MSKFIGTKIVDAVPGKLVNGCLWPDGLTLPKREEIHPTIESGFTCNAPRLVVEDVYIYDSGNGFTSWASKTDFEKEFRPAENMSFGQAIEAAKQGKQIARRGWNGKGQYVELASCIAYIDPFGYKVNADHAAAGNRAFAFVGTSGVQLGWLASQADMLAEDWYIVEFDHGSEAE